MMSLMSNARNRHKQKRRTFVFDFWDFKLVPIDSALNSGAWNSTYFLQLLRCVTESISQTQKIGLKFFLNALFHCKTEKNWNLRHLKLV